MNFEESMSKAAKVANAAVFSVMNDYASGDITDEDDITPALVWAIKGKLDGKVGGLTWSATIPRHRGSAAEEARVGADILIHLRLVTPTDSYSKGGLIQAKRIEAGVLLGINRLSELHEQCERMIKITPASFVFNYMKGQMRYASAVRVFGSTIGT